MSIVSSLFPPKLQLRPRSPSNVSVASSRSGTATSALSTPNFLNLSPRSSSEVDRPPLLELAPKIVAHLHSRDILSLSATSRKYRDLRTSMAFLQHLTLHGWDTDALVRRSEMTTDSKRRPWMELARSAVHKDDILLGYALLPKEGEKGALKDKRRAAKRFFRALIDVATEHDCHNFTTLQLMAESQGKTLIQFVSEVQAHDWKTRYRKTFVIAAYINSQPLGLDAEGDLEALAETLVFDNPKPPVSFVAARANVLYSYGCTSSAINLDTPRKPVPSTVYDPPHLSTSHGTALPGIQHALDRLKQRRVVDGFYRKVGGELTSLRMEFEPKGLASRSRLPFTERGLLTLTATVTDGDGNPSWEIDGSFDLKTGLGKFKNSTGNMFYDLWLTPWGVTGEKIRGESKHLGYFVLHWA